MVLRLRGADANAVRTQQLFLRQARWDDAPILAAHRELMAAPLGEAEGVLAIDGTDIPKTGASRWAGAAVLRPAGQAGQLSGGLRGLPGMRVCGPGGPAAVSEPGVGLGVQPCGPGCRRTRLPQQAAAGPGHADRPGGGGLAAAALGDLRRGLQPQPRLPRRRGRLGLGYLAEVARNTQVWAARRRRAGSPRTRSSRPRRRRSAPWPTNSRPQPGTPSSCGRAQGSQAVLCAVRRVAARRGHEPGPDVWLLLRRNPATDELKCYLSNGPAEMAPERLVWLAGLRWPIEQCFRDGKQLFGLGDYEGRSWQGWHRHATLVILAHFFVVRETLRLKKVPGLTVPQTCCWWMRSCPALVPRPTAPWPSWTTAGAQCDRLPFPCPAPSAVLRVPVPAI